MAGSFYTYSFLDVNASISGPGGGFPLATEAGPADEGLTIESSTEINGMTIGADGSGMHTLKADKSGRITVRMLKSSPTNAKLSTMLAFQRTAGSNHGQNTISIVNKSSGDAVTCQQVAFAKVPTNQYAKDANIIEWMFDSINIDMALGAGVQQ